MDLERDPLSHHADYYAGVEEGLPGILRILEEVRVPCDFFVTGDVVGRYPALMKDIVGRGLDVGCHGLDHHTEYYCLKSPAWQMRAIGKATQVIIDVLGIKPTTFRAPNFSANEDTLRVLETLGYKADSSVLPGRVVRKALVRKILDFRGAPVEPYNPSLRDICKTGTSAIVEIPVTQNPLLKGAPIGLGFLNSFGLERTLNAIEQSLSKVIVFLIHPWEFISLSDRFENIPIWMDHACKNDPDRLERCLRRCKQRFRFDRLRDVF